MFDNRAACEAAVKGYAWAQYKSFPSLEQAEHAFSQPYEIFILEKPTTDIFADIVPFEKHSIAVDAACSGNPGVMEYQGVDLESGAQIFHEKFEVGTNNIGEFLALVHGLSYLKEKKSTKAIYSDSKIAMNRIRQKKCTTLLAKTPETEKLYQLIDRALHWLKTNTFTTSIYKRNTEERGEIPADFGRK